MRVLVVDDDEILLRATAATLKLAGFDVGLAISGEQALEMLGSRRYEAVLVDLMMPRMNGIELVRAMKGRDPEMRVVLTSSYPLSSGQLSRMDLENVEFVSKPASSEELSAALRGVPARERSRRREASTGGFESHSRR